MGDVRTVDARPRRATISAIARLRASASASGRIESGHLPLSFRAAPTRVPHKPAPPLDAILEQVEARMIRMALQKSKGNRADAADRLGITRSRLLRRIEALKIAEA